MNIKQKQMNKFYMYNLPVVVAEVPDNRKMKMSPAFKEARKFSENEGGLLPGFMMESY